MNAQEQKACNEVIEFLENNGWKCSYFMLKHKPLRPSVLPESSEAFEAEALASRFLMAFWSGKLPSQDVLPEAFLIECSCSTGLSIKIIKQLINGFDRIKINDHMLTLPSPNLNYQRFIIPLSARLHLLNNALKLNNVSSEMLTKSLDSRIHIRTLECFKGVRALRQKREEAISVRELMKAIENKLFFEGLEAVLVAQLKRYPLPVSPPPISDESPIVFRYTNDYFFKLNKTAYQPQLIQRSKKTESLNNHAPSPRPIRLTHTNEMPYEDILNWNHECIITLKKILFTLKKTLVLSDGTYVNSQVDHQLTKNLICIAKEETLKRAEEKALSKANLKKQKTEIQQALENLNESYTSLELACERIAYHLIEKQNTLGTCIQEITSIFYYGFFQLAGTEDLELFDEEELELLTTDILFNRNHSKILSEDYKTQQLFTILNFAKDRLGLFNNLELPKIGQRSLILTKRNHVVGALEFNLIKQTENPTLYLAFYAGLRSGEIENLTLGDVFTSRDEVMIYIRKGKTPSAKRTIHFHLLAPKKVVHFVRDYIDQRVIHYRVYRNKNKKSKKLLMRSDVKLLSLDKNCEISTSHQVVKEARDNLKQQIGNGADLHLLRHSFASHLFLRWYCTRHPELIQELVDRDHWFFSEKGIALFNTFLGNNEANDFKSAETTTMIHLIKLMGHKNTETFFAVYLHSFEEVIHHALKKAIID